MTQVPRAVILSSHLMNETDKPHIHRSLNSQVMGRAKSGTARAALLGVSDGLVTNVSLILGVAAAGTSTEFVRLAGFASLIAGAVSMAVGEYISMRGQVELLSGILDIEREEFHAHPDVAKQELRDIMLEDGMSPATAETASVEVAANSEKAMAMYTRGKLGIDPEQLGSVWGSAASSLVMFSVGALLPLLPWFYIGGTAAIATSLGLSVLGALAIGAYLGHTTGGNMLKPAIRQLIVLIIAASATYLIGRLFHTQIG